MSEARTMTLAALAERLDAEGLLLGRPTVSATVTGITDDSRHVQVGDLFCAWSGTATDGHDYVAAAAESGAAAALVERRVRSVDLPQVQVRNGRRAAAIAASALFGDPQRDLTLVGVTGTNGKTTTVWVLRHMLSQRGPAASLGTLGVLLEDGSTLPGSESLTTPGPVQLARTLRLLVDRGVRSVAMEVSSHALDQGRVHTLRFDAALFTNLTRDHLDYHGTLETYLGAKRSLVRLLKDDGWAVLNADDPAWAGLGDDAPRAMTFGTGPIAEVRATEMTLDADGVRFRVRTPHGTAQAQLPLPGAFNVHNGVGAAAVCLALGYSLDEIVAGLGSVPQVPGRLERIATEPCAVVRDYAHTPDALARVLEALRPLTAGRVIVVFGAGGDRDAGKRAEMGSIAEQLADIVIVTSDNPRTEDPAAIIAGIEAGMSGARHERIIDRRAAIRRALEIAEPRDIVLLAGKGHETYQIIGTEKHPFDERVIVRDLVSGGEVKR